MHNLNAFYMLIYNILNCHYLLVQISDLRRVLLLLLLCHYAVDANFHVIHYLR